MAQSVEDKLDALDLLLEDISEAYADDRPSSAFRDLGDLISIAIDTRERIKKEMEQD